MSAEASSGSTLRIGDLVIDTGRHEVHRGPAAVKLPKLSYRMLLVLAEAAPSVVTQDQLIERVWQGRVVSPETVTQRVKLLRAALDDDANEPRYIALVRGEGYRLIPEIRRLGTISSTPATGQESVRNWLLTTVVSFAVAVTAAAVLYFFVGPHVADETAYRTGIERPVQPNSVAVLPFVNASLDPDDTHRSDGMAGALIDALDLVGDINVMSRSSSFGMRDEEADATTIASILGVEKLVEGTLERNGDQYTITVGVVDGSTGFRTWSEPFAGDWSELPDLQRRIAESVIAELVPDYEGRAASRGSGPLDPTAYDLMLMANSRFEAVRDQPIVDYEKLDEAIDIYRRLIEREPDSAPAHSRLAAALMYKGNVAAAAGPIHRALTLDRESAEAHYTMGLYRWLRYEDGSGEAYERAIALNPNYADAQEAYAKYVWHQLVSDTPEVHFLHALAFDSQRLARYADLANFYGMSGRQEKALGMAREIATRFDGATAWMAIARTYELIGEIDEAIGWAQRAHGAEPDRRETAWMVAELFARIGDFESASRYEPAPAFNLLYWERRYDDMIEIGDELIIEHPGQPQIWYGMARAFNAVGRHEDAIDYLRRQNIPARAFSENRRANDEEAMISLASAFKATGKIGKAQQLASEFRPFLVTMLTTGGDNSWWPHLYLACIDSILDDEAAALSSLARLEGTWGMPWYPLLVDAPCFRDLSEHAGYRDAVRAVEARKAALRDRLPETLARLERAWSSGAPAAESIRTNDSVRR